MNKKPPENPVPFDPSPAFVGHINVLSSRINVIDEVVRSAVDKLTLMVEEVKKREDINSKKLKSIDLNHYLAMEARHDLLSDRLQLLIEKVNVVTECCYSIRHNKLLNDSTRGRKLASLMWCFDLPDDWWEEGLGRQKAEGLDVATWTKRCFDTYRNYELMEATNGKSKKLSPGLPE